MKALTVQQKKARDYEAVSGEVSFYGDAMEQKIRIPLIDDGKKDSKEKTLTLKLTQIKGDSAGIGKLVQTETTVSLTNSGTGKGANLATILTDPDSIDLSGSAADASGSVVNVSPSAINGTQKSKKDPITASIAGYDGDFQLQTYDYGKMYFSRRDYDSYSLDYWIDAYDIIDAGPNWPNA